MGGDQRPDALTGRRFIIIEDNFPVASGLKYLLESAGCDVAGMAGNIHSALALVADASFDLALLDIDLRGEIVTPIAEAVRQKGKPLVFLTGFGDGELLPPHLRELPRLEKPVDQNELFGVLRQMLFNLRA